jgi:hypothetical protein
MLARRVKLVAEGHALRIVVAAAACLPGRLRAASTFAAAAAVKKFLHPALI